MKQILLLIILVLTIGAGTAQVPGYQGKRFIVKYDCGIMHPFLMGRSGKLPQIYNNLTLDYVVSRAWSIGTKYNFMTYNAPTEKRAFNGYDSYGATGLNPNDFKGRYTQHVAYFVAKKYYKRKGFIAPVGRYIALGVYYQYTSQHITTAKSVYDNITDEYENKITGHKVITHFGGVSLGMGRTVVLVKRLVLDFGFTLNLAPFPPDVITNSGGSYSVRHAAYRELLLRNIFQVHLGLGALAF